MNKRNWSDYSKEEIESKSDELSLKIDKLIKDDIHPEILVEIGISLIMRGIYRYGSSYKEDAITSLLVCQKMINEDIIQLEGNILQ